MGWGRRPGKTGGPAAPPLPSPSSSGKSHFKPNQMRPSRAGNPVRAGRWGGKGEREAWGWGDPHPLPGDPLWEEAGPIRTGDLKGREATDLPLTQTPAGRLALWTQKRDNSSPSRACSWQRESSSAPRPRLGHLLCTCLQSTYCVLALSLLETSNQGPASLGRDTLPTMCRHRAHPFGGAAGKCESVCVGPGARPWTDEGQRLLTHPHV